MSNIEAIKEAIRRAVEETGNTAFNESQAVVPVVTGELKRSGSVISLSNGIMIQYTKEYASIVERGWKGGRVWTESYIRKDGVRVKGHYKNQPPREGVKFIENSIRKCFIQTGNTSVFQDNLLKHLKEKFPVKQIISV